MTNLSNVRWTGIIPSMFDLGDPQPHPGSGWRELLETHGVTQAELARETATSAKHINQILQGHALPSAHLVLSMAKVVAERANGTYPDEGRRLARLMWNMQSRHVFDEALLSMLGQRQAREARDRL